MRSPGFVRLLRQVPMLNRQQRSQLLAALRPAIGLDRVCETIEHARPAPLSCPGCGGSRHYRHGASRGLQRYRCRACNRTFNALSGTPLARLRFREKWLDFSKEMLDSRSVRAAAKAVEIHRNTSFHWRHRFLGGVRHLRPVLDPDVLLVTDGHRAYQTFARQARIAHAFVNLRLGERVRGAIHVQNVNAYHQRLRSWLARFRGVASRYLPNYLGWRWALDGERIASPERLLRAAVGIFHT